MSARVHAPLNAPVGLERAEMVRPRTLAEACALLADASRAGARAMVLAGGTDLFVERHLASVDRASSEYQVDRVVDVTAVGELGRISEALVDGEARLVLGGGVTFWRLRTDPRVARAVPMLAVMARDVGAVQIQTRATIAGNLASASPAADGAAALLALGGVVRLVRAGAGGALEERRVALADFFTGYRATVLAKDEVIAAVDVRVPRAESRVTWRKVGTRLAQAISKVSLAAVIEMNGDLIDRATIALASVAATPCTPQGVCRYLEGQRLADVDRSRLDAVIEREIRPIDDVRSTAEYRLHVVKALVWRALRG
jgi:CO/xanthine dehydrogenase FAD-binding subunit